MKNLKRLFLLGGLFLLTGTVANAELVNGVRQKPVPTATQAWVLSVDTMHNYYLYNPEAKAFFTEGNAWGTQVSIGNTGLKIAFTTPTVNDVPVGVAVEDIPEDVYLLNDFSLHKRSWKLVFFENDNQMFVDRGNQANFGWGITPIEGTNNFRIHVSEYSEISPDYNTDNYPEMFVGLDVTENAENTVLSPFLEEGEGHYIDWTIVTPDIYKAYLQAMDVYNKAQDLKAVIDEAKARGVNVAAQEAVYLNEAATIEELEVAISDVKTAVASYASVDSPADMTTSIINPGFDNGIDGWNGTQPTLGAGAAEFFQKNYDMYQVLTDMPNGVYGVSVQGYYRPGWTNVAYDEWLNWSKRSNIAAKVYAMSGADSLNTALFNPWAFAQTGDLYELWAYGGWLNSAGEDATDENGYIPNNMQAASYLFNLNPENYKKTVYIAVDNGELAIGLKKNDSNPNGNWTMFDNFTLSYFGTAPEAYQMCLTKGMPAKVEYTANEVSMSYIDPYYAAYNMTATDKASLSAAMKAIYDANDAIILNIQLWTDLHAKYNEAYAVAVEYDSYDAAYNLGDYLEYGTDEYGEQILPMGVKDYLGANHPKEGDYDLSNDELENIIATINMMIEAVYTESKESLMPGTDVTKFLTNPDFEEGTTGWTIVSKGGGNVQLGGNDTNHCYEAWHSTNFDVYQEVSNLPVGLYKLEVNGYVRYMDGQNAIDYASEAPADVPIYVYMNDSKTNLVSWSSYPKPQTFYEEISGARYLMQDEENCFPDNLNAASAAFADGGYSQYTICLVTEANAVTRIGVMGTPEAKFWPVFDNFKLTYLGTGTEIVKPQLEDMIAEAKKYEYEVTIKTAKVSLTSEITAAEALLVGENGDAMLEAIDKLQKAINDVTEGRTICQNFYSFIEDYMQFAQSIDNQEALQLGATILENLNACAYDPEDIEAQKLALREMRLKVQLPADYAQGSAEGVDVTAFIQTPEFSKYQDGVLVNSIDGWQYTAGYNFGNDDTQRGALAVEYYQKSFNMYQYLTGVGDVALPKGNYRLQVNAFERVTDDTPAYLYVETESETYIVELMKHADGYDEEAGESGPNDMISSVEMFEEGRYLNTIDFRSEGDIMRIGILHENWGYGDWIIMDNFKLYYYGEYPVEQKYNSLYIADGLRFSTSKTNMLPISLKNEDEIVGFQFDVVLPQGMSLATNEKGKNILTMNADRSGTHSLTARAVDDFTIRVVGASMENEVLSGVDGVLMEMGINVADWVSFGEYPILLKDVKLTNANRQTVLCSNQVFYVTVGGKLGDVNHDDAVDVTDAVLIIDDILLKNPANYDPSLADVNGDGYIDVTDVVTVIDAILGKVTLSRGAEPIDRSAYTAFQMDLTIPVGYVLESVSLTDIAKDSHSLAYNMLPDGRCRVVVCSMNNEALPGAWDEVIRLNLRGNVDAQVNIDRAVFVTIDGERHELMMNPTSIAQLSTFNSPLGPTGRFLQKELSTRYDLQGRKVEKNAKGILLENGKKVVKK